VYCLAATQEEVGCRSVCVAARRINPDISIDFDVTFATDGGFGINNSKHGEVRLGAGAVLSYGPDKSLRINTILKKGSNRLQEVATNRAGGTNTRNVQLFSDDCETTLVSIPNRSMHTRVEVCDWRDVQSAVDAVTYAITVNLL
jgi:endoglucanase